MKYNIISFNPGLGSAIINFFTDECPSGLVYSVDIPIENGAYITGAQLDSHIMRFAPYGQIERVVATISATVPSDLSAFVPVPAEIIQTQPHIPSITPRQIRMALTRMGMREVVETAVSIGDQDIKDWWEFSLEYKREHPQVALMVQALGIANEVADQIWALGATL